MRSEPKRHATQHAKRREAKPQTTRTCQRSTDVASSMFAGTSAVKATMYKRPAPYRRSYQMPTAIPTGVTGIVEESKQGPKSRQFAWWESVRFNGRRSFWEVDIHLVYVYFNVFGRFQDAALSSTWRSFMGVWKRLFRASWVS